MPLWTRLPALLLVSVALHQIWLARSAELSAWNGGGFGMFASTDVWGRRHLHASLILPGARRELEVPASLREEMRRTVALPTEARLRSFALKLVAVTPPENPSPDAVAISVYARRFDPQSLAPSGAHLRSLRVEIGGSRP